MSKWSRRAFITTGVLTGSAAIFGVSIRRGNPVDKVASFMAGEDETLLNVWLKIAADNSITVIAPHAEMGQGIHTVAMQVAIGSTTRRALTTTSPTPLRASLIQSSAAAHPAIMGSRSESARVDPLLSDAHQQARPRGCDLDQKRGRSSPKLGLPGPEPGAVDPRCRGIAALTRVTLQRSSTR